MLVTCPDLRPDSAPCASMQAERFNVASSNVKTRADTSASAGRVPDGQTESRALAPLLRMPWRRSMSSHVPRYALLAALLDTYAHRHRCRRCAPHCRTLSAALTRYNGQHLILGTCSTSPVRKHKQRWYTASARHGARGFCAPLLSASRSATLQVPRQSSTAFCQTCSRRTSGLLSPRAWSSAKA